MFKYFKKFCNIRSAQLLIPSYPKEPIYLTLQHCLTLFLRFTRTWNIYFGGLYLKTNSLYFDKPFSMYKTSLK